jgi:hypothetical protein
VNRNHQWTRKCDVLLQVLAAQTSTFNVIHASAISHHHSPVNTRSLHAGTLLNRWDGIASAGRFYSFSSITVSCCCYHPHFFRTIDTDSLDDSNGEKLMNDAIQVMWGRFLKISCRAKKSIVSAIEMLFSINNRRSIISNSYCRQVLNGPPTRECYDLSLLITTNCSLAIGNHDHSVYTWCDKTNWYRCVTS